MSKINAVINVTNPATNITKIINLYTETTEVASDYMQYTYENAPCYASAIPSEIAEKAGEYCTEFQIKKNNKLYNICTDKWPLPNLINWASVTYPDTFTDMTTEDFITNGIPDEYTLKYCTNASNCFSGCENITEAPFNITSEDCLDFTNVFYRCLSLNVFPTIPNSVTNMTGAFQTCINLENLPSTDIIPNTVTDLTSTFSSTGLTTAPNIPNSVTTMVETFKGAMQLLIAPTIPDSVTNLSGAFDRCFELTCAPHIGNSVIDMSNAFYCTNLISCPTIPDSVRDLSYAFSGCGVLNTITTIPKNVTNVVGMFESCTNLTEGTDIPSNINNMYRTFYNVQNISGRINIYSDNIIDVEECFAAHNNTYELSLYCNENTETWNTFYNYLGGVDNEALNIHLLAMPNYSLYNWAQRTYPDTYEYMSAEEFIANGIPNTEMLENCTNAAYCFNDCKGINEPPFEITSQNCINVAGMFKDTAIYACPNIPNGAIDVSEFISGCGDIFDFQTNIPSTVTNMANYFAHDSTQHAEGNMYIYSNNVINCDNCFEYHNSMMLINIFCYKNSQTWNTFQNYIEEGTAGHVELRPLPTYNFSNWAKEQYPDKYSTMTYNDFVSEGLPEYTELSKVFIATNCFADCESLEKSPFDITSINCQDMSGYYRNCISLQEFPLIPKNITNLAYAFANIPSIQNNLTIYSDIVNDCSNCFENHDNTYSINVYCNKDTQTWNTFYNYLGGVDNEALNVHLRESYSLYKWAQLTYPENYTNMTTQEFIDAGIPSTEFLANCTNASCCFENCRSMEQIPFAITSPNCTDMSGMLKNGSVALNFTSEPLIIPSGVTNMADMFNGTDWAEGIIKIYSDNVVDCTDCFKYHRQMGVIKLYCHEGSQTWNSFTNLSEKSGVEILPLED